MILCWGFWKCLYLFLMYMIIYFCSIPWKWFCSKGHSLFEIFTKNKDPWSEDSFNNQWSVSLHCYLDQDGNFRRSKDLLWVTSGGVCPHLQGSLEGLRRPCCRAINCITSSPALLLFCSQTAILRRQGRYLRSTVPANAEEEAQSLFVTEVRCLFPLRPGHCKDISFHPHLSLNLVIFLNSVKEIMVVLW